MVEVARRGDGARQQGPGTYGLLPRVV